MRTLAQHLEARGFDLYQHPFDCLAVRDGHALLVEGKTLDGSPSDERRQAEKALGQIRGYRHFDMPDDAPGDVELVVAFSQRPTDEMGLFLQAQGMAVVWPEGAAWVTLGLGGDVGPFEP